ncbi:MAG: hypothetical protein GY862_14960 [Gammaproteobacteria bacterium]|nr:hypothetical protein [Gammaproteobacteria bacterium]
MGLFDKIKTLVGSSEYEDEYEDDEESGISPADIDKPPYAFIKAMHAIAQGNIKVVREHLSFNKDYVHCKDWDDNSLLHKAAHFARPNIVELLLANEAEVNACYKDKTPLHFAIGTDAMWAKTNKKNTDYRTHRLHQQATVKLLLVNGADVDAKDEQGETPLHVAVRLGFADLAQSLLSKGATVDMLTKTSSGSHNDGRTPLLLAARHSKNAKIIEFLLRKGANPNAQDPKPGYTALHYIAATPFLKNPAKEKALGAVAALLLAHKANPNISATFKQRQTPLHLAAGNNHVAVAEALLAKGADINAKAAKKITPMGLAAKNGYMEMVACLLDQGVDVYKSRAMFYAAYCKISTEGMRLLLDRGVDINRPDEHGVTPLFAAISANSLANVKFMLENGADTKLHPPGTTVSQHAFANWGAIEAMPEKEKAAYADDAKGIIELIGGFGS